MRPLKIALMAMAFFSALWPARLAAKTVVEKEMYIFGFAASFNDSVVYFTEVQKLDSVWMDSKTDFMLGRENYSYQFRDFLRDSLASPHRTCIVMFSPKKKDINKKLAKFKKIYCTPGKGNYDVRHLSMEEFAFQIVDMSDPSIELSEEEIAKRKKAKKERKKRSGSGMPPGGGGPGGQGGPPAGGMGQGGPM